MALYAFRNEEIRKRVLGVACLSTPFLVTKRRNNVFWHTGTDHGKQLLTDAVYAALFGIFVAVAVTAYAITGFPIRQAGHDLVRAAWAMYAEVIVAHLSATALKRSISSRIVERLVKFAASTAEIESELDLGGLDTGGIFIARSIADEASSFIGMSQVIAWFTTRIWLAVERLGSRTTAEVIRGVFTEYLYRRFPRTLAFIVRLYVLIAGIFLAMFTLVSFLDSHLQAGLRIHRVIAGIFSFIAVNFAFSFAVLSILIILRILLYLLAPPITALLTVISLLPFGWELAIRNILLGVSAESTPKGAWKLELVESIPVSEGSEVPLSHSEIYDNEVAITKLIAWMRDRCAAAGPGGFEEHPTSFH